MEMHRYVLLIMVSRNVDLVLKQRNKQSKINLLLNKSFDLTHRMHQQVRFLSNLLEQALWKPFAGDLQMCWHYLTVLL